MAINGWNKIRDDGGTIAYKKSDKILGIQDIFVSGWIVVFPQNKKETFQTKSQALKRAKQYMRNN